MKCYRCGGLGHVKKDCSTPPDSALICEIAQAKQVAHAYNHSVHADLGGQMPHEMLHDTTLQETCTNKGE
jgi:hypothetical protein